jgi:hypothetical protein
MRLKYQYWFFIAIGLWPKFAEIICYFPVVADGPPVFLTKGPVSAKMRFLLKSPGINGSTSMAGLNF